MTTPNPSMSGPDDEAIARYLATQNPERNGLGLSALILGIVGLLFCLVPFTGFIGFILGVIAVSLGIAGFSRVRKNKASNGGVAITGTVLGALAIIGGIVGMVIVFSAVDEFSKDMDEIGNSITAP